MLVTKCDICSKVFEHSSDARERHGEFRVILALEPGDEWPKTHDTDCCPECTKKIENFVSLLKMNEDDSV